MEHNAVIPKRPTGPVGHLLSGKSIFDPQPVMRKRLFVKDMSELVAEVTPIVVGNFEQAVFDTKSVQMIYPQGIAGKFRSPTLKIFPIE